MAGEGSQNKPCRGSLLGHEWPSERTVKLAMCSSFATTSEMEQTMCLATIVNATLHFVSFDRMTDVVVMLLVAVIAVVIVKTDRKSRL